MIIKSIEIDGKEVLFKASAAIPRIYRAKFARDIFGDLQKLEKQLGGELSIESLETFENIAYIMAKHADPNVPATPEEWLDEFNTFSIYLVLPQLIELWGLNVQAEVQAKKKLGPQKGK